jgi:hypothetical protein
MERSLLARALSILKPNAPPVVVMFRYVIWNGRILSYVVYYMGVSRFLGINMSY